MYLEGTEPGNRQIALSPRVQLEWSCSASRVRHELPRWPQRPGSPPSAGTSTPPGISAAAVHSIAAPLGVNGFSALPPQSNGQPTSEPIYTNGIHPYPGESRVTAASFNRPSPTTMTAPPRAYKACRPVWRHKASLVR